MDGGEPFPDTESPRDWEFGEEEEEDMIKGVRWR